MAATITASTLEELKAVAKDGRVNMFDRSGALMIAADYGFYDLIEWAEENPKDWGSLIMGSIEVVG